MLGRSVTFFVIEINLGIEACSYVALKFDIRLQIVKLLTRAPHTAVGQA